MSDEMCPLCLQLSEFQDTPRDAYIFKCKRCGTYEITRSAKITAERNKYDDYSMISGYTRNSYEYKNEKQCITMDQLPDEEEYKVVIEANAPRTVQEKADLILKYIAKKTGYPGQSYTMIPEEDYPVGYCKNKIELIAYLRYLNESSMIDYSPERTTSNQAKLTFKGWQRLEKTSQTVSEIPQAFVAMRFKESLNAVFLEGIEPLSAPHETGYLMRRIDRKEFNGDVVDEIMAEIRRSRFLIADVTIPNNGVFLEAGFASGLGKPVIWTCRKSAFERHRAHFDTNHMNHILWETPEDLKEKLKNRILGTLGPAGETLEC